MLPITVALLYAVIAQHDYEWVQVAGSNGDVIALIRQGKQIGSYDHRTDVYRPLKNGVFGDPEVLPFPVTSRRNYGLRLDKIRSGEHYILNGEEVDRERITQALRTGAPDDKIPDRSKLIRVVVIGTVAECAEVEGYLAARKVTDSVILQSYRPDHWQVQDVGYVLTGRPSIYVLDAAGTVLFRRMDAVGGVPDVVDAIRRADPNYRPDKDPNPKGGGSIVLSWIQSVPVLWWFLFAGIAVVLFLAIRK